MQKDSEYSVAKGPYKGYPGDWIVIELGILLNKVRRPVEVIPDHEYREIGIRSHGKGLFHKEPVKGSDLGSKSVFWVEVDCLIINIVFAWEQAVGITTAQEKGMIASHRFPMWQPKGNIDLNYLLRIFLTPYGRYLLELASPGGAGRNRTLGRDNFDKTPVCIPSSIKEQQRIVQILSAWDKAIGLKEQLINEKKRQKKWLMQNLLTGVRRLPGFTGEWQKVRLGDVCTVNDNLLSENTQSDLKFWYVDLSSINGGRITEPAKAVKFDELPLRARRLFKKGDILMSTLRPYLLGFAYIDKEYDYYVCSTGFAVVRAKEGVCSKFVYYALFSEGVVRQMNQCLMGTNYPALSNNDINQLYFELPLLPEQAAIADIISTADREIDLHKKQLGELIKQKNTLTQLLLTGAVRVNSQEVS
ncbi:MAG: Type I restriction modification DNA specificity domain protein [Pelotomaculum sp. PtaU1.Bin035]|nr:MAG: Type I restriction modification DNA specificity domain protein [Pelotomaculum sp. PtaU1.Bin035]